MRRTRIYLGDITIECAEVLEPSQDLHRQRSGQVTITPAIGSIFWRGQLQGLAASVSASRIADLARSGETVKLHCGDQRFLVTVVRCATGQPSSSGIPIECDCRVLGDVDASHSSTLLVRGTLTALARLLARQAARMVGKKDGEIDQ